MENTAEMDQVITNRDIDSFLLGNELHIEWKFALTAFNLYQNELDLRARGFSLADLKIDERRHAQMPTAIHYQNGTATNYKSISKSDTPKGSFAYLKLSGVMRSEDGMSTRGIDAFVEDLYSAYENPNISGVIIEANSGGGESVAGTKIKDAISCRNKPVVNCYHTLGSAAYLALMGCDEIIALGNMAQAGSLGTFISISKKGLERYISDNIEIYAADSSNKNLAIRQMAVGDYTVIQTEVTQFNKIFMDEIASSRNLRGDAATVKHTLSGAMFGAQDAKQRGLIDMIGNRNTVLSRLAAHVRLAS